MLDTMVINVNGGEKILLRKTSDEDRYHIIYEGEKDGISSRIDYTIGNSRSRHYTLFLEQDGQKGKDYTNSFYSQSNHIKFGDENLIIRIMRYPFPGEDNPSKIVRHSERKTHGLNPWDKAFN